MKIFLIGFMGCGKSHWAKIWGEKYGIDILDLDCKIEENEHSSINEIFKSLGEDHFRKLERKALLQTANIENCLIACGGGTPAYLDNLKWMKDNGVVVYLSAEPEYLLRNILKETNSRPLLKGLKEKELLNFIEAKLTERKRFYESADLILNSADLSLESYHKILDYA